MKFTTKLFVLILSLASFYSSGQDLPDQQVPRAKALTAEQIATTQEYADFQQSMHYYSLAVLTSDSQAFEDRLQELSSQGKLILPLETEQFSSIGNAAVYATALNNLERKFNILEEKFSWRSLGRDFKMEILRVYQAASPDVLANKILKGQKDHQASLDTIAFSDEFHAYRSAIHQLFAFSGAHSVDHDAVIARMLEYPDRSRTEEFPAELLADIPFAQEHQELNIVRAKTMKVLKEKFQYMTLSQEDRAKIGEIYQGLHKTFYTDEEVNAILLNHGILIKD
jgi:hypothetical protein